MSQKEREATALRVNLREAQSNLLRTQAARLDLEGKLDTARLDIERLRIELDANTDAAAKQQAEVQQLEARIRTYDVPTLKA